jgi:hypothetical protein
MLPAMNETPKPSRDDGTQRRLSGPDDADHPRPERRTDAEEPSPEEEGYGYGV